MLVGYAILSEASESGILKIGVFLIFNRRTIISSIESIFQSSEMLLAENNHVYIGIQVLHTTIRLVASLDTQLLFGTIQRG